MTTPMNRPNGSSTARRSAIGQPTRDRSERQGEQISRSLLVVLMTALSTTMLWLAAGFAAQNLAVLDQFNVSRLCCLFH